MLPLSLHGGSHYCISLLFLASAFRGMDINRSDLTSWFRSFPHRLEESVRVDREPAGSDSSNEEMTQERLEMLSTFHVTESANDYLTDLFARVAGEAEGDRQGGNHWLYGYYGSGKSHLLAVTGYLLDSKWISEVGKDQVWANFSQGNSDLGQMQEAWELCLNRYHVKPLLINLLKDQSRRDRGFGRTVLRHVYLDKKWSPHLRVAFFEKWYLEHRGTADELEQKAQVILEDRGANIDAPVWEKVQQYPILAEGVLPRLFEKEVGTRDGYEDVVNRNLKAEVVADQLETARQAIEAEKPTRLLLLLDEMTLFIGTHYSLLTELNALAEAIDAVGGDETGGPLFMVGTAQEDLSRVQSKSAAQQADFSMLDDRFPHQPSLPSSHVGDIVQSRLLEKSASGQTQFEEALAQTVGERETALVFRGVEKNTTGSPLDEIRPDEVIPHLPLLPYQPELFLDILASLRETGTDRAKSVFSGTARAVLALVKGLLEKWAEEAQQLDSPPHRIISLVDFFEMIRPELKDIIPQELKTIEAVERAEAEGTLRELDVRVCKVVLLLQHIPEMIPLSTTQNIAVAVTQNLSGETITAKVAAIADALDGRLKKYIRSDPASDASLRFTTRQEREAIEDAEANIAAFSVQDVLRELTEPIATFRQRGARSLWQDVLKQLDVPYKIQYEKGGGAYATQYTFAIDGHDIETTYGDDNGLKVRVQVEGLVYAADVHDMDATNAFRWSVSQEADSLWTDLKRWAAFAAVCRASNVPESIEKYLLRLGETLPDRIAQSIKDGELKVQSHEPATLQEGIERYIRRVGYQGAFHPEMLFITKDRLAELKGIRSTEDLPDWARAIGVVCSEADGMEHTIFRQVRGYAGRPIKEHEGMTVQAVIEHVNQRESAYEDVDPALVALLWGLCQCGTFLPVTEDGEPVDADVLLDATQWHRLRLRIAQGANSRTALERLPTVTAADTHNGMVVKAQTFIKNKQQQLRTLQDRVDTVLRDMETDAVTGLFNTLLSKLQQMEAQVERWIGETKSSSPSWEVIVEEALKLDSKLRQVESQWTHREVYLLQLDALLFFNQRVASKVDASPEVSREAKSALDVLSGEAQQAPNITWWTESGWTEFADLLAHRGNALKALRTWWKTAMHETGADALLNHAEDHAWLVSPIHLPGNTIGRSFQRRYLDGPRSARRQIQRAVQCMYPLIEDAPGLDTADVRRTMERLRNGEYPALPDPETIDNHLSTLRTLDDLTEGCGPSEIAGVGFWPDDSAQISEALQRTSTLSKTGSDIELISHSDGVIITARS